MSRRSTQFLTSLGGMTASLVYGFAVTTLLALYYAIFKHGDLGDLPRLMKMVGMQLTPWMMMGYGIARKVIPDAPLIHRPQNLLLPAVEGVLATVALTILFVFGELRNPYLNFLLDAMRVVTSVVAARFVVRRSFRW